MIEKINAFLDKVLDLFHLKKYRQQILYLIVGGGTTVVDWVIYAIFVLFVPPIPSAFLQKISPNILSYIVAWFGAVLFSYVLSRVFVFESRAESVGREFLSFVLSRLLTLALSVGGDILFCGDYALLPLKNPFLAKLLISVLVVILNYITGKFLVFRKGKK